MDTSAPGLLPDGSLNVVKDPMSDITLIMERRKWTSKSEGRAAMKELLEALRPFMKRGLRVRVALSHTRLDEDEIWKP